MAINDILKSGDYSLVLTIDTGVYTKGASNYAGWTGGTGIAQPLQKTLTDNSSLVVSSTPIHGINSLTILADDFFFESAIGQEFEAIGSHRIAEFNLEFDPTVLLLHLVDFENRDFTLDIGYAGSFYSDFERLVDGKTLSYKETTKGISIAASAASTLTNALYPPNTFEDGRAKPKIVGSVKKISPVKIPNSDFIGQFHDGDVDTSATEFSGSTSASFDASIPQVFGEIKFRVIENDVTTENTSYNTLPLDTEGATGSIVTVNDRIEITPPDYSLFPPASCDVDMGTGDIGGTLDYRVEMDLELNEDSTADVRDISGGIRITKTIRTISLPWQESTTGARRSQFFYRQVGDDPADVVKINLYAVRFITRQSATNDVQAYDKSTFKRIPTYRIPDVSAISQPNTDAVLYDDLGFCTSGRDVNSYVLDAVGGDADILAVAAMDSIATDATTGVSIASAFTGERVGQYYTVQDTCMQQVKLIGDPLDYVIKPVLAGDYFSVERRYNHQRKDFDGNANELNDFSLVESDFVLNSIRRIPRLRGEQRYTAFYAKNYAQPSTSPSQTTINTQGNISLSREIQTPLVLAADALNISSLVSRSGARVLKYSFSLLGQGLGVDFAKVGLGIQENDTGKIFHPNIHNGAVHITKVRPSKSNNQTYFEADIYV